MPTYMSLFKYTPEGLKGIIDNQEERASVIDEKLKEAGGRMISFYYCLGEYHGVTIYEMPSGSELRSMIFGSESMGYLADITTFEVFDSRDENNVLENARGKGIQEPGG